MAAVSAYHRELSKHKARVADVKKKKVEKKQRVLEMLLAHKEKNGDAPCTNLPGYSLDENNNLVKA